MLGAICGLIVAVLLRILVEYLSGEFTFLAAAVVVPRTGHVS